MSGKGISSREIDVDNLFTKLGYFTRAHIQIFPIDLKSSASDIDVLAIKFSSQLKSELKLIEVKEGHGTVTNLFQLYGLKTYFQNADAYLVAQKIHEITRGISKNLGISVLTFDRLRALVASDLDWVQQKKRITVELESVHLTKVLGFLKEIKSISEELFWTYHYLWLETNPYKKFYHLQRLFSKVETLKTGKLVASFEAMAWYERELFCLALVAAMNIAGDCTDLEEKQLFEYIENQFYNVGGSKEGKLKLKEGIDKLAAQIETLSKGMVQVPPVEVVPNYVLELTKLVELLIRNAPFVQSYLLTDNNIFRTNLKGESRNLKDFTVLDIQYKMMLKVNSRLLKILYEGKPIDPTFKDFI